MDSLGVTLAVSALIIGAVADLLYRVAQQRGIEAPTFVFWQSTLFTGLLWIASIISWVIFGGVDGPVESIRPVTWLYGIPAGVIAYGGLTLFVASLRHGDASVNAPIFRLNFVITAVGAIILFSEPINLPKVIGTILAIVAILVLLNVAEVVRKRTDSRSLTMAVGASFLFGVAGLISKAALDEGSGSVPLILTQTVGFQLAAVLTLLRTRHFSPNRVVVYFAPGIALLQIAWSVLLFESLRIGDASVSYPIVQMSFIGTAILAVVFLREEMTKSKFAGLILASVAVVALALGA